MCAGLLANKFARGEEELAREATLYSDTEGLDAKVNQDIRGGGKGKLEVVEVRIGEAEEVEGKGLVEGKGKLEVEGKGLVVVGGFMGRATRKSQWKVREGEEGGGDGNNEADGESSVIEGY